MKAKINKTTIQIQQTNILSIKADALVHSTDPTLSIPAWLLQHTGDSVRQTLNQIGWCDIGSSVTTLAGNLPHRIIVHVVPPKWGEGSERGKLANAVWEALDSAENHQCKSIVLPPIATGTDGYPIENCAKTMLQQIIDFTFEPLKFLREITICVSLDSEQLVFEHELSRQRQDLSPNSDGHASAQS
jgi:O-acetyl-ADP-ribose deacetylase (regulator of RNase III)